MLDSGKNISPEEVENTIETMMPTVAEAVVYQATREGSARKFLVASLYIADEQVRSDRAAAEHGIRKVNAVLPPYKRIDYIELPDAGFKRTASRKIVRTALPTVCSGKGIELV